MLPISNVLQAYLLSFSTDVRNPTDGEFHLVGYAIAIALVVKVSECEYGTKQSAHLPLLVEVQ